MHELKHALRAFVRTPGATGLVVATLAIAMAAAIVIASTIDMVWHFVPVVRADRLAFVASTDPRPERSRAGVADGLARTGVSIPDLVDWTEGANTFEEFAAFTIQSAILTGTDTPARISTAQVTHNLLNVWGIVPQMGRTFIPEEGLAGRNQAVVLTHPFWQRQLSSAPDVVGKALTIDGRPHTVVGVLPPNVNRGIFKSMDVFVPIVLDRERAERDDRRLYVTGRVKPGVPLEQAEADLAAIASRLQTDHPRTNAKTGVVVRPFIELLGANINAVMGLLSAIGFMVVCIACANVSSIILAHAATRRRELAVRAALGASRMSQIRQLMVESFVISAAAGAVGLMLAWWGVSGLRFAGNAIDGFSDMTVNVRVLAAGIVLILLAPLGFALLPALRMSKPDMDELRQGNRGAESTGGRRLREGLVVAQIALALVLMTQVGLIGRTTWRLHYLERGFDADRLLTMRMNLAEASYGEPPNVHDFYSRALERIQAVPGVVSAGTTTHVPVADRETAVEFLIQGVPAPQPESQPRAARAGVSADYLKTMRISIIRGRGIAPTDVNDAARVALVSQEAARRYWPNQDPIGQHIAFRDAADEWLEIVGIAGDVRNQNVGSGPTPQIYVPSSWRTGRFAGFVVRSAGGDPVQLAPAIRAEIAQLDRTQPVYDVRSMQRVLVEDLGGTYLFTGMLIVFAIVALLLAAAGVYGLVSFSVSQRTREIGLRMALGARPATILGMIVARGSVPMTIGLLIGAAGTAALVTITAEALNDVDPRDPLGYIVVGLPLVAIALLATYIPARKATRVDPLTALRAE